MGHRGWGGVHVPASPGDEPAASLGLDWNVPGGDQQGQGSVPSLGVTMLWGWHRGSRGGRPVAGPSSVYTPSASCVALNLAAYGGGGARDRDLSWSHRGTLGPVPRAPSLLPTPVPRWGRGTSPDAGGTSAPCYLFVADHLRVPIKHWPGHRDASVTGGWQGDAGVTWGVAGSLSDIRTLSRPYSPKRSRMGGDQDIIYCLSRGTCMGDGDSAGTRGTQGTPCGLGDCRDVEDQSTRPLR